MNHRAYLSMGSNMGDRRSNLDQGCQLLAQHPKIDLLQVSSLYQTSPVGEVVQDDFINLAAIIETDLSAYALLDYIHEVEAALHRKREIVWGPRTLDIDILFFDNQVSEDPDLRLPHPELFNRLFVLVPLAEIISEDFPAYPSIMQSIAVLQKQGNQRLERVGRYYDRN